MSQVAPVCGANVNWVLNGDQSLAGGDGCMVMLCCFMQPIRHQLSVHDAGSQLETPGRKKLLIGLVLWEGSRSALGQGVWATSLLCSASCT